MNEPDKAKEVVKADESGVIDSLFQADLKEAKAVGETETTLTAEPVDLTGNQEVVEEEDRGYDAAIEAQGENITPEDFGKEEAIQGGAHNGENPVDPEHTTLYNAVDPDAGTSDDPANDGRLSTVRSKNRFPDEEKPEKVYPVETPIEFLFNPNNKKIFPVNEDIIKQKGLVPCTEDGKLLPDHRRQSDFR